MSGDREEKYEVPFWMSLDEAKMVLTALGVAINERAIDVSEGELLYAELKEQVEEEVVAQAYEKELEEKYPNEHEPVHVGHRKFTLVKDD